MDIMKLLKTRILPAFLALMLMLALLVQPISVSAETTVDSLGALWDGFTSGSGTFTVTTNSRVYVVSEAAPTGNLLQTVQLIQRELGAHFAQFGEAYFEELVWGDAEWAATGDIVLKLDSASGTGADGYKLNVTGTTATVTAADTDGLIYGANNLIKCFRAVGGSSISGFSGYDTPDTKERTVHLDLARKYYTVEWVCNFIRQMSWMGYNALELHLSEDGGFRADFWDETYYKDANNDGSTYKPVNDFSWLCGSYIQSWVKDPYRKDFDPNKYLTTAELVQICEVAKEYHIEIIPSFDSPAHMDYITWKFEQNYLDNDKYSFTYGNKTYEASSTKGCINYSGRKGDDSPTWPYYTTIDITEGTMAKAFVFALYEDMADFFKEYAGSTNFNIGADEVNLTNSAIRDIKKWNYSAFPGYINELNQMLNKKGYTVRMYNDFIGSTTYNQEYDTSEGISDYNSIYDFDDNIEICYWDSDFNPTSGYYDQNIWHVKFFWENNTGTTDNWGDGGRTMYNCIQTNTYYVLRQGTSGTHRDARDPENRNWTFYGTNEEDIYNKWYPADISEKGVYTEDAADVPADQLGGAYFLIWNDYAALNTESEVWEGALDCWDKDRYYYLFDIMASNIIKMWNSDINSTVTYTEFAEVREAVNEWFPGFTSCSKAASLPAASDPVKATAADHTALEAALKNKISNDDGTYTTGSYKAYETAYDAAVTVNENHGADDAQISDAISNLNSATDALVKISGLRNAINSAPTDETSYTSESWSKFQTALNAAKSVLNDANATQEEVNNALTNLNAAIAALDNAPAEDDDITEEDFVDGKNILKIQKISETATVGKYVGLIIHTSKEVNTLAIKDSNGNDITLAMCINSEQTLSGEDVRVWLINFAAEKGEKQYKVFADNNEKESGTITITAK